jgi:hypothetical protein
MKRLLITKPGFGYLAVAVALIFMLLALSACSGQKAESPIMTALAGTSVPDLDLDLYLYFQQATPTLAPKSILHTETDLKVESLAVWGIVQGDAYGLGGTLNFSSPADAASAYALLPEDIDVWTRLEGSSIYAVYGTGAPYDSLKAAVQNHDFKMYDDKKALNEAGRLPYSASNRPLMVGLLKAKGDVFSLVKQYVGAGEAETLDSISKWVKPQVLAVGVYTPQPVQLEDIWNRAEDGKLWDVQAGLIASVNSSYPGIVFSPIADKYLSGQGYPQFSLDNLRVYQMGAGEVDSRDVSIWLNVSGNHIFGVTSTSLDYSKTLMRSIPR